MFPYDNIDYFEADKLSDDECLVEFRFLKNDVHQLAEALDLPEEMKCYNGTKADGIEALCIYLKLFVYPSPYSDIMLPFGRDISQLSIISNLVMNFIYKNHKHHLGNFGQDLLSPLHLQLYVDSIHAKEGPLNNCWGFIDGTVRPMFVDHSVCKE